MHVDRKSDFFFQLSYGEFSRTIFLKRIIQLDNAYFFFTIFKNRLEVKNILLMMMNVCLFKHKKFFGVFYFVVKNEQPTEILCLLYMI